MLEPEHPKLSVRQQCRLPGFSRSGWYSARDCVVSEEDAEMMGRIERVYTERPWYGSSRIRALRDADLPWLARSLLGCEITPHIPDPGMQMIRY